MVLTISDVLNIFNEVGVFSYVLPFLVIFALVFALLKKSEMLGKDKAVHTIIAAAVGLLSLQFDMVPLFFANIFPKLGVFLAILLAILLLFAFTGAAGGTTGVTWFKWIGVIGAVIVVLWAMSDFMFFGGPGGNFFFWMGEYFWTVVVIGIVSIALYMVVSHSNN